MTSSTPLRRLRRADRERGEPAIVLVVSLLHLLLRPLTRRDWRGTERVPQTGGVVFVVNHISNADPLAVGQFLAFAGRWPRFLAKSSLFEVPVVGRVIAACGQIPVYRNTTHASGAVAAAVDAVRRGRAVVVYPEGTITADPDLWPMRGKSGAARITLLTDCPVVPIGQWGPQDIWYGRQLGWPRLFPRRTFRLLVGEPVPLDDLRAAPLTAETVVEATGRIMAAITDLVAELRAEVPPARAGTGPSPSGGSR